MVELIKIDNITQYNNLRGIETLHPLVTAIDVSKAKQLSPGRYQFNLYSIYLKEKKCGDLFYGRSHYDYQEGTVVALGPGQIVGIPNEAIVEAPRGWALLFHPDLLNGTVLGELVSGYSFFSYEITEALHLSKAEQETVRGCFHKVLHELSHALDKHSRKLITANIELLLSYCTRYYDRQFITREDMHKGIPERLEILLNDYFNSESPINQGLPTVSFCAASLHFSANYFGDLIKKDTGKSAQEFIHAKIVEFAKLRLMDHALPVGEIAYSLGFKYPQHFTRLFKERVGMTPVEYRLNDFSRN
ncbi:helix-turn-helix transcriptional regulator [Pedobacter aquatilis]|uniref:helix-turn-helix domain-containing protein n=1 Tax=Pedobacter aquatilis TaxID=351343 RepID=UPI0029308274|nr:helix-turn-helix transcriptional regulator [Pedobacter aquatilis]